MATTDYDPQADLGKIRAPVHAVNFGDDMRNPAGLPRIESLITSR